MNRLGNLAYKRLFDTVRGSIHASKTDLRRFTSTVNGGEKGKSDNLPFADSDEPLIKRNLSNTSKEDAIIGKFKLGAKAEESPRESPKPSTPTPNPTPTPTPTPNTAQETPAGPERSEDIFKRMKETGLIPNAVAMLDGLCKDGLVQDAMRLFGEMRNKGTIPEVVVYTAVVDGFCRAKKPADAVRIFRKMQKNGITPNAFSYNVAIRGLCNCERSEEALGFCFEMLEALHSPNVASFVILVQGLCRDKGVAEAKELIAKMREKGFVLNEESVKHYLDTKGCFSPEVWEVIFGHKKKNNRSNSPPPSLSSLMSKKKSFDI